MKAVICTGYGAPEVLQIGEAAEPSPKDHEVLIKVRATTVHVGDTKIRKFDLPPLQWLPARLVLGLTSPRNPVLGMELSGEIESVGKAVTQFKPGDAVFALTGFSFGAYAEYKCMPENGMLAAKPTNLSFEEAAAVPGGGLTALTVLRKANLQRGQTVLIYGASGSVGSYAVQLARHFGADVVGVCSGANVDLVKSLGAGEVIDYTRHDFSQHGKTYDVVFDAVDKLSPTQGKALLKSTGIYLNVRRDSGSDRSLKPANLRFLKKLIEEGAIRVVIDRCYPFDQIVDAHRYVDQGHKKGNVVITVSKG